MFEIVTVLMTLAAVVAIVEWWKGPNIPHN